MGLEVLLHGLQYLQIGQLVVQQIVSIVVVGASNKLHELKGTVLVQWPCYKPAKLLQSLI